MIKSKRLRILERDTHTSNCCASLHTMQTYVRTHRLLQAVSGVCVHVCTRVYVCVCACMCVCVVRGNVIVGISLCEV